MTTFFVFVPTRLIQRPPKSKLLRQGCRPTTTLYHCLHFHCSSFLHLGYAVPCECCLQDRDWCVYCETNFPSPFCRQWFPWRKICSLHSGCQLSPNEKPYHSPWQGLRDKIMRDWCRRPSRSKVDVVLEARSSRPNFSTERKPTGRIMASWFEISTERWTIDKPRDRLVFAAIQTFPFLCI